MSVPGLRRAMAAASITVLAIVAGATAALAADPPGIAAAVRDRCVTVTGRDAAQLKLVQKRDGIAIASATGGPRICVKPVLPGDILVATDTIGLDVGTNTFLIPPVSVIWSPRSNLVKGHGPADDILVLTVRSSTAGIYGSGFGTAVPSDADGNGSWAPPVSVRPFGSDRVELWWQSPAPGVGLQRVFVRAALRSAVVAAGSATVRGTAPLGRTIVVRLSRKGAVVATASGKASGGDLTWRGTFRTPGGAAMKVRAGDKVSIVGVPSAFRVRTPDLVLDTAGGPGGDGSLTATCAAGSEWAFVRDGVIAATDTTTLGPIALDGLSGSGDPVPFGTRIQVACESPNGVGQIYTVIAQGVG